MLCQTSQTVVARCSTCDKTASLNVCVGDIMNVELHTSSMRLHKSPLSSRLPGHDAKNQRGTESSLRFPAEDVEGGEGVLEAVAAGDLSHSVAPAAENQDGLVCVSVGDGLQNSVCLDDLVSVYLQVRIRLGCKPVHSRRAPRRRVEMSACGDALLRLCHPRWLASSRLA